MTSRERFFYDHAGYSYNPATESEEEGKRHCAQELAAAEEWGEQQQIRCLWEADPEPYEMGEAEDAPPEEVLCAYLANEDHKALGFSLCGIGDPAPDYRRVVAAELLLEARAAGIVFPQSA